MSETFATFFVPAARVEAARRIAAGLSPGGAGMWIRGASPTGEAPATHYVSTGFVAERFVPLTRDAAALYAACQQAGVETTADECAALVAGCDVSGDDPFAALARLALQLVPA